MRTKQYSCPNGCKLPHRKKELYKDENGNYSYGYDDFNYCPICGNMMPSTKKAMEEFFKIYNLHPKLKNAERLILKSEFTSAVREASAVLESVMRKKSGLDLHGFDLATKSLKFECDKQTGEITVEPRIAISKLKTESEKNEQDGIRYMLMGFFQGVRNNYMHNEVGSGASYALAAVINASFFLKLLEGHSITKKEQWIPVKVSYEEIYSNMPKRMDRIRYKYILKKRLKRIMKNNISSEEKGLDIK